ncbi:MULTISPECIES: hypothetical protein [Sorangium]|uniref:Uncharacterized protein n=1 Tax=Sorangium cellulosum TaxID=56 RepID=A0A4P2QYB1_SORCE|nr:MULTISPECIES: hypothetical protein [Sorangium]AUX35268.1 uncharacterized protein SOCE836_074580 [Sorangium cellulosum]WCQ94572.1 hypothetical protein NQZ70_07340 [Sorangium sp. Soce836]
MSCITANCDVILSRNLTNDTGKRMTHPYDPPADDTWPLRERILAGYNFVPLLQENFVPEHITSYYPATAAQVETILQEFVTEDLADTTMQHGGMRLYGATPKGWRAREQILLTRGLRHPALVSQLDHTLEDLMLALAMAPTIHNSKRTGTFGEAEAIAPEELLVYLREYSEDAIRATFEELPRHPRGFFAGATKIYRGSTTHPAIALTKLGRHYYDSEISLRLGLAPNTSILEFDTRTHLDVFWAWQSEFRDSRNIFKDALKETIRRINRNRRPVPPLRLIEASEPGDGAIRIDVEIQNKIRRAELFVGDLTAVYQYDGRLRVNENVLVEVGYALASKDPAQILLLALARDTVPGPNAGPSSRAFDIAHVHRIEFKSDAKPADVRNRIQAELEAALTKRGHVRQATSVQGRAAT